jgi:hypothetical protein
MMVMFECEFSDETSDLLILAFYFLEKKEDEVKKKDDAPIYEYIRSSRRTKKITDTIYQSWEKSEKQQASSNTEKYEEMKSIKSFATSNIKSDDGYDRAWNNEKVLEERHFYKKLLWIQKKLSQSDIESLEFYRKEV